MLTNYVSRNRRADQSEKVHNAAVRKALERKAIREFIKVYSECCFEIQALKKKDKGSFEHYSWESNAVYIFSG